MCAMCCSWLLWVILYTVDILGVFGDGGEFWRTGFLIVSRCIYTSEPSSEPNHKTNIIHWHSLFVHIVNIWTNLITGYPHSPRSLQIPLCLAEKLIKYELPRMVCQSVQFVPGRLVFIVHTYKFVTLQGSVCGLARWCRQTFQ